MADQLNMQRFGPLDWKELRLEPSGTQEGVCDCCGTSTRRVWGFVRHPIGAVAAYFVGWTIGRKDHGASFDLIVGAWGSGATQKQRGAVSLTYRAADGDYGFAIVDATDRPTANSELVGRVFTRHQVVATTLADQVFAIADAIFMTDARLDEVRTWK
jgi:hypothetical protein